MPTYRVIDPQHVYEPVNIEVPFTIDPTKQTQRACMASYYTVLTLAAEAMWGCPLWDVAANVVRDTLESLQLENPEEWYKLTDEERARLPAQN
jgi:hypothetical protein